MSHFQWKKKYTVWVAIGIIYLAIILAVVLVSQNETIRQGLSSLMEVLSPVIFGLALAYLANPLYNFIYNTVLVWNKKAQGLRKLFTVLLMYLVILLFLTAFIMLILPQLTSSINDLTNNIWSYLEISLNYLNNTISKIPALENTQPLTVDMVKDAIRSLFATEEGAEEGTGMLSSIMKGVNMINDRLLDGKLQSYATTAVSSLIGLATDSFLALLIAGYVLAGKQRLGAQVRKVLTALFRKKASDAICDHLGEAHHKFGLYFKIACLDSLLVALICFILCAIFSIPYALLVAVMVGVTNIIPYFGPFLGAIPSAILIFIADPPKVLTFVILILILQQIDGNMIVPRIHSNSMEMSPLGIIVSLTVMGGLFGIVGMFIGVPVASILCDFIKEWLESRLKANGEPTEVDDYAPAQAEISEPETEKKTPFLTRFFTQMREKRHPGREGLSFAEEGTAAPSLPSPAEPPSSDTKGAGQGGSETEADAE